MNRPAASSLYRMEAVVAYRLRTLARSDEAIGAPPRWPFAVLLAMVGLLVAGATSFRVPVIVEGVAGAVPGGGIVAVVQGSPRPGPEPGHAATLHTADGREIRLRVTAVTVVTDPVQAEYLGLPASVGLPLTVVDLDPERAKPLTDVGGRVRITTATRTLVARWTGGIQS